MLLSKSSLLGVSITIASKEQMLSYIKQLLYTPCKVGPYKVVSIVTPNPEQIMLAQKNEEFRRILNDADVALPDGAGVVWGLNHSVIPAKAGILLDQGIPDSTTCFRDDKKVERISGVDFMEDLCRMAGEKHWKVLFLGGREGVAEKALTVMQKKYPGLEGIAEDGPEISDGMSIDPTIIDTLIQTMQKEQIRMVFVGLGAPKQEYVMEAVKAHLSLRAKRSNPYNNDRHAESDSARDDNNVLFMSVGGSFDMLAGKVKRAPAFVQNIGFEWLWRLIQEPWRWRRQLALVNFIRMVLTNTRS